MREIIGYRLARADSETDLEKRVEDLIKTGWQPYGPLVISAALNEEQLDWYYQPVVRYAPDDEMVSAIGELRREFEDLAGAIREIVESKNVDKT